MKKGRKKDNKQRKKKKQWNGAVSKGPRANPKELPVAKAEKI